MLDISWIVTLFVALVTWYFTRHWVKIRSLPPGPIPWPIVGNLLALRSKSLNGAVKEFRGKYGDIFTLWLGSVPFVIVCSQRLIKEGLIEKKTDFAGRPQMLLFSKFMQGNLSITTSEYSRPWEILRKMGQSAIRKYATSEQLPPLIDELMDETVEKMLKEGKPFSTRPYIYHFVFNVITSTIIGEKFHEKDPSFLKFRESFEVFQKYMSKGFIGSFVPILKPFVRRDEDDVAIIMKHMLAFMEIRIKQHQSTYDRNKTRDMIDHLFYARDEAVAEFGKENTEHLNDGNISQIINDVFGAGTDTIVNTLGWLILHLVLYPKIQENIIQEIKENIGDRVPTQDDRKRCSYTVATITEIMRLKTIAPYGLPHMAITDTEIGGHAIKKGTALLFQYGAIHMDPTLWKNPEKFIPERFLGVEERVNGILRMGNFMAFGTGRRMCAGEKLATEELFLAVVGIFRRCRLALNTPPKDLNSQTPFFEMPKHHTVTATRLD